MLPIGRKLCLADIKSRVGPCTMVPDVGGLNNVYFQVKPRQEWAEAFVAWVEQKHYDDKMEWLDEEEEEPMQYNPKQCW
jgi:hypothetical protein